MAKIDCNSQDGIISFIERASEFSLLKQFYSELIVYTTFEKKLKEILKRKKEEPIEKFLILWESESLKDALLQHLTNHLEQADIKVKIQESQDFLEKETEDKGTPLIILCPKDTELKGKEFSNFNLLQLSEQNNYYLSVFEIIEALYPVLKNKENRSFFKEQAESLQNTPQTLENLNEQRIKLSSSQVSSTFTKKVTHKRVLSASLCLLVAASGSSYFFKQICLEKSPESCIRADLITNNDYALLQRPELLKQIESAFDNQSSIQSVALVGIGGAGKTTLARQYASSQKALVIWEINAENSESLKESFKKLAQSLAISEESKQILREIQKIKDPLEKEKQIISFVKEHIRSYPEWLLIFDNVEKFSSIKSYFPHDTKTWGRGKIIITTQDSTIHNNSYVENVISIDELGFNQMVTLFTKIINHGVKYSFTPLQLKEAKQFLENIPPFPLDISVASYYLKMTKTSYADYLENLKTLTDDFIKTQTTLLKEAGDYKKTRYAIISLSIQSILKKHKDFSELLLLVSFLDSQNISKDLLISYKDRSAVDNFIYNLRKYSFIVNETPPFSFTSSLSIHRSTQEKSRIYLIKHLKLEKNPQILLSVSNFLEKYINDIVKSEDISKMKSIVNHYESFLNHKDLIPETIRGAIGVELGQLYYYLGNYVKSKNYLKESLNILNKESNKRYDKIARALVYLANMYNEVGNSAEAREAIEQSLSIYKQHLPNNYEEIALNLTTLGNIYRRLGDYEKARDLAQQCLVIYEQYLPNNRAGIAQSLAYLGNLYRRLGNYEKAIDLLERSLNIYQNHFSEDHINVAWVSAQLGNVHKILGDYEKAKVFLENSFTMYKTHLSENHMTKGWAYANLGNLYSDLQNYEKAKKYLERGLMIYKNHLSENHITMGWIMTGLGNVHEKLGNYESAKECLEKSRVIHENHYGKSHIEIASVLRDLGQVYLSEGSLEEAEAYLTKAHEIFQRENHPERYTTFEKLSDLYLCKSMPMKAGNTQSSKNLKTQATIYLKQALEIVEKSFPNHFSAIANIRSKLKILSIEPNG